MRHRRFAPTEHAFTFPLFMVYLDLDELPHLFRGSWLWSSRRIAPAWLRRRDYLGDPATPLKEAAHAHASGALGRQICGPVRMLTHVRQWGYLFNPVTFYYCYTEDGRAVDAIIAEITNTPWKERHAYTLDARSAGGNEKSMRFRFAKNFHISPFMPMSMEYDWRFSEPGARAHVQMDCAQSDGKVFDATLGMRRREATTAQLRRMMVKHPLLTLRVAARIHLEALRLWRKGVPVYPHPARSGQSWKDRAHERTR